jgi:hypothetical protein
MAFSNLVSKLPPKEVMLNNFLDFLLKSWCKLGCVPGTGVWMCGRDWLFIDDVIFFNGSLVEVLGGLEVWEEEVVYGFWSGCDWGVCRVGGSGDEMVEIEVGVAMFFNTWVGGNRLWSLLCCKICFLLALALNALCLAMCLCISISIMFWLKTETNSKVGLFIIVNRCGMLKCIWLNLTIICKNLHDTCIYVHARYTLFQQMQR